MKSHNQRKLSPLVASHEVRAKGLNARGSPDPYPGPRTMREDKTFRFGPTVPNLKDARQALANEDYRSFNDPRKVEYAKERSRGSSPSERDSMSRSQSPHLSEDKNKESCRESDIKTARPQLVAGDPRWIARIGSFSRRDRNGAEYHVNSKDSRIWAFPGRVQEAELAGMNIGLRANRKDNESTLPLWQNSSSTLGSQATADDQERVWDWLHEERGGGGETAPGEAEEAGDCDVDFAKGRRKMRALLREVQADVPGSWARLKGFVALNEREGQAASIPFTVQLQEGRACLNEGIIGKPLFDKLKIRILRGPSSLDRPATAPWCSDGVEAVPWTVSSTVSHPSFSSLQTSAIDSIPPAGKSWQNPSTSMALIQSGRLRPMSGKPKADFRVYKPRRQSQVTIVHYDSYHGQEKMSQTRSATVSPSSDRTVKLAQSLPRGVELALGQSMWAIHAQQEKNEWIDEMENGRWAKKNWMNQSNVFRKINKDELWEQYVAKPGRKLH